MSRLCGMERPEGRRGGRHGIKRKNKNITITGTHDPIMLWTKWARVISAKMRRITARAHRHEFTQNQYVSLEACGSAYGWDVPDS